MRGNRGRNRRESCRIISGPWKGEKGAERLSSAEMRDRDGARCSCVEEAPGRVPEGAAGGGGGGGTVKLGTTVRK